MRLIQALDSGPERASALKNVFLHLIDPYDFLANAESRRDLFELLRVAEASALAAALELEGDAFDAVCNVAIQRGSERFTLVCAFFGLRPEPKDQRTVAPNEESIAPEYGLFEHQQAAVRSALELLSSGTKRVVLHMPTGAGKTRMAMHVVAHHLIENAGLVIWLANSEELCEQAAQEFSRAWRKLGNRPVSVSRFWGARALSASGLRDGVLVAGFPKLYSLARSSLSSVAMLGDRTTLLVVDEAHQAIAPTYKLVIDGLSARSVAMPVLGLTATPGRTWNDPEADKKLADFFSRRKVTLQVPGYSSPVDFLIDNEYLARPEFEQLVHESGALSGSELALAADDLDVPAAILRKLASDERRSLRILRTIENIVDTHRRIILFATTVAHAKTLTGVLVARGISARCVTGDMGDVARASAIEWFKGDADESRVVVNFGVLTTGFDAPRTSAAVIARPTKSLVLYSQMVGRATRGPRAGGNKVARIVTVVDTALPGFGSLAAAFTNWEDVW